MTWKIFKWCCIKFNIKNQNTKSDSLKKPIYPLLTHFKWFIKKHILPIWNLMIWRERDREIPALSQHRRPLPPFLSHMQLVRHTDFKLTKSYQSLNITPWTKFTYSLINALEFRITSNVLWMCLRSKANNKTNHRTYCLIYNA